MPPSDAEGGASPTVERPTRSYVLLTTLFNAVFAGVLVAARRRLPLRLSPTDLGLLAVATFKLSRLVTKDRVTAGVRAPFTQYEGEGGPAEVEESPRGHGLRRAIGELIACPYCLGQWISAGFVGGMLLAPRVTRTVAAMLAIVAGQDVLQHLYGELQQRR
jgi:hypothetical protein